MTETIMLIGPNGVGKTKMAYDLARKHNGEVINLDRTYLYKGFPLTTGMSDALEEKGVNRHLYEMLRPDQESYPSDIFVQMVIDKCREINSRGKLAIAEGASTLYVPALLKVNAQTKIFNKIIGLKFVDGFDVREKYRRRIDQAFENGLLEELRENLASYKKSFLIKECHFAVPTIKYIEGELNLDEVKEEILQRCLDYMERQISLFKEYDQIDWIDV